MRMLHTMLRVGDLQRSIDFYTQVLGMQLLRQKEYPDGKFTLAFVGYGSEAVTQSLNSPITGASIRMTSAKALDISR